MRYWIDNAFLANEMHPGREYIVEGDVIYPVDYKSTGVTETNKKWGDGLQQFLEMKHGLPRSPLTLISNFLSNIDVFERYGNNIIGVSGTLGDDDGEKNSCVIHSRSISLRFQPPNERNYWNLMDWFWKMRRSGLRSYSRKWKSAIATQRAALVICEDIATANELKCKLGESSETWLPCKPTIYLHSKSDKDRTNKLLEPGDVVVTTNLGARGTDFVTDEVVNKNGGLFVLVTFIPFE